ncbi:hypothetical protein GDO86_011281 [Hymenochirus boettgeri]|uniref:G-protein coupled receptors family 1 profile domain-containing protein n=1 Tax=Hymenochirus boettgeri TaxID=247094 RepID=A0A8T2JFU5_9PIPI|nr:hypothetical protein GDO86_011281 [Hymenochirus boettgeri]
MTFNSTNTSDLNGTYLEGGFDPNAYIHFTVAAAVCIGLCLIGIMGNVIVFWYLFFWIQRNKYTVYIINLAVADFICLLFIALLLMVNINTLIGTNPDFNGKDKLYLFLEIIYDFSFYSGMFILTAISIERCISVCFPIWYQRNRPKNLSAIICACLWILGATESLIANLACSEEDFVIQTPACTGVQIMTFVLNICICLPLMMISSFILLITIKRTYRQRYPSRLYILSVISAVFVFILSVTPITLLWFLMYFKFSQSPVLIVGHYFASMYCTALTSTANPYIYFIVGRQWKHKSKYSIYIAFISVFTTEEEDVKDLT